MFICIYMYIGKNGLVPLNGIDHLMTDAARRDGGVHQLCNAERFGVKAGAGIGWCWRRGVSPARNLLPPPTRGLEALGLHGAGTMT